MRRMVVVAAAIVAVGTVGACSSGGGGGSSKGVNGSAADLRGSAGGAVAGPQAADGKVAAGRPESDPGRGAGQLADRIPLADATAKIRTADLRVAVRRGGVAAAADRAGAIASGAGGEVDADNRTTGRYATAGLQLRVPPAALTRVLHDLSRLGQEKSRQLSTTDVTEKVADVNSRVASAQRSIASLRTLYASATKVGDVIAIESELSTREADLESLQAQQRALARQTSMAAISLQLETAVTSVAPARPAHHRGGFIGGLQRGWDGFSAAAAWVATAVGTVLPFAILLLLVALGARLLWRRLPHRPRPVPAPSE